MVVSNVWKASALALTLAVLAVAGMMAFAGGVGVVGVGRGSGSVGTALGAGAASDSTTSSFRAPTTPTTLTAAAGVKKAEEEEEEEGSVGVGVVPEEKKEEEGKMKSSPNASRPLLGAADAKKAASFLGQEPQELGNSCESGIHEPVTFGENERFTTTLIHLLPYADMTYIVCTKFCDMPIPEELRGKVLMVNGYEIDKCLQLEQQSHWVKASLSHGAAIAHAKANNFDRAAVLEEDTTSGPNPYVWQMGNYQELNNFLSGADGENWNVIRLGYRPVQHEHGETMCSESCKCEDVGSVLCYMRSSGCELHSSDAYILRSTQFDWMLRSVAVGTIIDYGLLEAIPGQLIVTPQVNYQTSFADWNDATDVETQLRAGAAFTQACFPRPMLTSASALV